MKFKRIREAGNGLKRKIIVINAWACVACIAMIIFVSISCAPREYEDNTVYPNISKEELYSLAKDSGDSTVIDNYVKEQGYSYGKAAVKFKEWKAAKTELAQTFMYGISIIVYCLICSFIILGISLLIGNIWAKPINRKRNARNK